MTWTHRPALDGLRSVAVYLVVLFHAQVGLFEGGFLGVDLFFVLSGFLVSSVLLDELDRTGRIDLSRFYARRVRRLLPAATVAVVGIAAVFLLVAPLTRRLPLVGDAQSSLLYYSNWRFLGESDDYFGAAFERSPYLHFWSLSIEEQFYVVFPLLLIGFMALRRFSKDAVWIGILVAFAASLAVQLYWADRNPNHAYYGTDARAYQLLAGVLAALAFRVLRSQAERAAAASAAAGGPATPRTGWTSSASVTVAMIALLLLATDTVSLQTTARGLTATTAATLVVLGLALGPDQGLARLLSLPPLTYLGTISYGTYLWHWPVVLVLREILDIGPWTTAALAALIGTGLAALSFEVLEHPIRTSRLLAPYRRSAVGVGLAASLVLALLVVPRILESESRPVVAASGQTIEGTAANSDAAVPEGVDWAAYAADVGPDDTYCTAEDLTSCVVHEGSSGLSVALVGDSHARMLAPTLERLAEEHDFTLSLSIVGGCSWQDGVRNDAQPAGSREDCLAARAGFYDDVLSGLDVDVVLLAQLPRDQGNWETSLQPTTGTSPGLAQLNLRTMSASLDRIRDAGARSVIFDAMLRVPPELPDPLDCLSGSELLSECRVPVPLTEPPSDGYIDTLAALRRDTQAMTINDLMCPSAPVCDSMNGRVPIWRDSDHYAPAAVLLQSEAIWQRLLGTGLFDAAS